MKKTLFFILLSVIGLSLKAQTYVGTMTVGAYTREGVKVFVQPSSQGSSLSMTMYKVKFARMMPVKLDVEINPVSVDGKHLSADNIVPTNKAKRYEKYIVRDLDGVMDNGQLCFTCQMGSKQLVYKGKKPK